MKKVLTVLLVVLLATSTVFAAMNVSGRFRTGYTFKFDNGFTADGWKENAEAKLTLKVSDDAGIWTINIKDLSAGLDSDDKLKANLSLNFTNLLAANGVDLGDFSITGSIGANSTMTALSAYNDVTGDEMYKVKNYGDYSTELAVGYGELIQGKIAIDPTKEPQKEMPIVLSVMSSPISGLSVSAAYAHNGLLFTENKDLKVPADHVLGFAVNADFAALFGLDFQLGVAAYDNIGFNYSLPVKNADGTHQKVEGVEKFTAYEDETVNTFAAAVYGGVDLVDAFFELRMNNYIAKDKTTTEVGMKSQVNLNLVENLGLDVYFNVGNFAKTADTYAVGGDVSYTISGVEFAGNLEYAADGGFSITPNVIVVF